jgi:hypothetical protein
MHEDVWWNGGTAPLFLISALDGDEWSASRLDCFIHGERVSYWRLGGTQILYRRYGEEKIISVPEI